MTRGSGLRRRSMACIRRVAIVRSLRGFRLPDHEVPVALPAAITTPFDGHADDRRMSAVRADDICGHGILLKTCRHSSVLEDAIGRRCCRESRIDASHTRMSQIAKRRHQTSISLRASDIWDASPIQQKSPGFAWKPGRWNSKKRMRQDDYPGPAASSGGEQRVHHARDIFDGEGVIVREVARTDFVLRR